ncbi:DUF6056 family protein [Streptococcus sobrinus]|uniref:DUF6056 family protein n=1 Tax=Streptococcus sobrinus TaxID=1310 RepID=UPI00035D9DA4|nr:DUF6056 family protein [Streptococcus sobrinus]
MKNSLRWLEKNKMKKFYLPCYYALVSLIFTLQSIVYINDVGDQTSFAKMAQHHGFLEFAGYRYMTWSSRLLIESLTMFMSTHYYFFDLTVFVSLICFFYCFNGLFLKSDKYQKLHFVFPILFLLVFPSLFFTSAGLIATVTNYLFPMIAFVLAWYFLEKRTIKWIVVAIPVMIFACMQEQFTIYALLIFLYLLVKDWLKKKNIDKSYLIGGLIALAGTISALFAPGSANRLLVETKTWFPGFNKLSLFTKITKGYLETNRVLFVSSELAIVYLLLITILVVTLWKHQYFSSIFSATIFYTVLTNRLENTNLLTAVQHVNDYQNQLPMTQFSFKVNLYPLLIYTVFLIIITIVLFLLFEDKWQATSAIIILGVGYAARMTVSLSPTIYASGLRTFTPLIFSGLIVVIMIYREFIDKIDLQGLKSFLNKSVK